MFKHIVFAAALGTACAADASNWKEAIDATAMTSASTSHGLYPPLGSGAPTDLDLDPTFAAAGKALYYLDNTDGVEGWGLRVFARPDGAGWYVLAKHGHGDGTWDAAVVATSESGTAQATYIVPTPMFRLDDATFDAASGQFYFAGGAKQAGHADSDFAVTCIDITLGSEGGTCSSFGIGGNGTAYVAFDRGGSKDDVARRIVVRPNIGVLLAGWAKDASDRYVFAATGLYRSSGALLARFGTGGRFTTDLGSIRDNLDVNVFDIALSNDPDTEARLYIGGNYSRDELRKNYDGVVLALNAWTGTFDTSFGPGGHGFSQIWLDLGDPAVDMSDAVTALTVRANGKLALAGWSIEQDTSQVLMLAQLRTDGQLDMDFCAGTGKCAPLPGGGGGITGYHYPSAIAERPDTRDLVVAMEEKVLSGAATGQIVQSVSQWSSAGALRTGTQFSFSASSAADTYAIPAAMLIDRDSAMVVGTRRYSISSSDYDVTLVRTLANDSLFADMFGGPASD